MVKTPDCLLVMSGRYHRTTFFNAKPMISSVGNWNSRNNGIYLTKPYDDATPLYSWTRLELVLPPNKLKSNFGRLVFGDSATEGDLLGSNELDRMHKTVKTIERAMQKDGANLYCEQLRSFAQRMNCEYIAVHEQQHSFRLRELTDGTQYIGELVRKAIEDLEEYERNRFEVRKGEYPVGRAGELAPA
jgi:hypothetical protein